MSMTTSSFQPCLILEESYCSPWDLKTQEDKLKLLNEYRLTSTDALFHLSSSNPNNNSFHRARLVRTSLSTKKSPIQNQSLPPIIPPLPLGGLTSSSQCISKNDKNSMTENIDPLQSFAIVSTSSSNQRTERMNTIPANVNLSFIIENQHEPMPCEIALLRCKRLNSSTRNLSLPWQETKTVYEQPWKTSLINRLSSINNRSEGSLQKMSNIEETKQYCSSLSFPIASSSRHGISSFKNKNSSNTAEINNETIDRYFWYHCAMSRRQAENVLESRSPGSFLVRQSESGNQNDYSLSIRTTHDCMHMRICYSTGVYILGECSRPFASVSRLIEYFSQTSIPVHGATHIKLGTPVSRWEILSLSLSNHFNKEFKLLNLNI